MECYTFTRGTNFVCVAAGLNQQWLAQFVSVLSALCHTELYMISIINIKLCKLGGGAELISVGGRRVRTGLPHTVCDDNRRCIIQFYLLMMRTTVLETCRGI